MLKKELEYIQETQSFDQLEAFKDPKVWKSFSDEDKGLLALLFFQYGVQLALDSTLKKTLKKAIQMFRCAIKLKPVFLQARFELGKTYLDLGMITKEPEFLDKANALFSEIESTLPKKNRAQVATFYWTWGRSWFFKGRISEELYDFNQSLSYFSKAKEAGLDDPLFLVDFGNSFFESHRLAPEPASFEAAINCYLEATKKNPACSEAWSNLACCYTELFFNKKIPSYFHLANDCFTKLATIQKDNKDFYFKWGQLLLAYGKYFHEETYLPKSIECFQLSEDSKFVPKSILYRFSAQALLLFGVYTDQLTLLKLAENKLRLSLDLDPNDYNSYCLLGHLKCEFGRYFDEETYFLDAIEAFEKGIELHEDDPILHFGLSSACFAYGEMKLELPFLEKAYKSCVKVIEMGAYPPDHFWNDWGIITLKIAEITKSVDSLKEAIQFFEKAVEIQKKQQRLFSSDLLVNLGVAWQLLGDLEDDEKALIMSREILGEAVRLDPLFLPAHHQLALTLVELGEMGDDLRSFEKAEEHFTHALHLDSEDDFVAHDFGMGLIHHSIVLHQQNQLEDSSKLIQQAEKLLKRAISLGNEGAYYTLACLYSLIGNLTESLNALEKAKNLFSLPPREDILEDEWLENLRKSELFNSFFN